MNKRVCLVGVSGYARTHYDALIARAEDAALDFVAATVINQEEEAEKCDHLRSQGVHLYNEFSEMLEEQQGRIDLCVVPTGIPLHAEMTCAALAAGANVLVEKPAAATVQDVDRMRRASESAGRFVAVGFQACYAPETLDLKQRLRSGLIGTIHSLKCRGLWPRGARYYGRNGWAGRLRSGGSWILDSPFNNAFSHYLNLMLFWAGPELTSAAQPQEITAELYRARAIESPDTAALRVRASNDVSIHLYVTHSCRETFDPQIVISGDEGTVVWTPERLVIRSNKGASETIQVDVGTHRARMVDAVLARLIDPDRFICTLDIARVQTLCANGAHESSKTTRIAPRFVTEQKVDHETLSVIDEIEDTIESAFVGESLFSENGVPWARPGRAFSLRGYQEFPQVFRTAG
jgi:predicted dehydrogenase